MFRRLRIYFKRRRIILAALMVSFILMFVFVLNEPIDKSTEDVHAGIKIIEHDFRKGISFQKSNVEDDSSGKNANIMNSRPNDTVAEHDHNVKTPKAEEKKDDIVDNKYKEQPIKDDSQKKIIDHDDESKKDKPDIIIGDVKHDSGENDNDKNENVSKEKKLQNSDKNDNGLEVDKIENNIKIVKDIKPVVTTQSIRNNELRVKLKDTARIFGNLTESGLKARKIVMEALEKDKMSTFEVDLSKSNLQQSVQYPTFIEYGKPGDPGEGGFAVKESKNNLNLYEKDAMDKEYKINQFNLRASKMVALHRTVTDTRSQICKDQKYDVASMPTCSIVLVFHDEAWTTLLRSVHSIIDRTPKEALLEIILLDDNSDQDFLKATLEAYIKPLKVVRLVRATERLGLIKARNLGFMYAKGEIVVFLDSHIECYPGWLEPLVAPIVQDPRTVTFPVIPNINKNDFGIINPVSNAIGSMRMHTMSFKWDHNKQDGEMYYNSPAMPGGLYAISREWFHHLGAYDPELLFWGGENLEVSFKIWQCGGKILASSCSYVAHVFRSVSPFHFDGFSKAIQKNLLRVADIWLDDFKHFYLEKFTYAFESFGDTSNQRQLRQGLQCKSFRWYLDNVNTRLKAEIDADGIFSGLVRNIGINKCLITADKGNLRDTPYLTSCSLLHYRQVWQFRTTGFLSSYNKIMAFVKVNAGEDSKFIMRDINIDDANNYVSFDLDQHQRLVERRSRLCLDVDMKSDMKVVMLARCGHFPTQRWTLQTRKDLQAFHKHRGVTGIQW